MEAENRDFSFSPDTIAAARAWVARRDAGLDVIERAELQKWLAADASHRRAFAVADEQRTDVDWALHAGVVDAVIDGLHQCARVRRRRLRAAVSAGCGVALVCLAMFIRQDRTPSVIVNAPASTLVIVEAQRRTLPDGSFAEVRALSEIAIEYTESERRIVLVRGAAHFQVRSNRSRPFVVTSGGVEVTAIGTEFLVDSSAAETAVLVTEGKVSVERIAPAPRGAPHMSRESSSTKLTLSAGQGVTIATDQSDAGLMQRTVSREETAELLAWRLPVLQFAGTSLTEIITAMNAHNAVQLSLGDPALGELQLTGALRADKIGALQTMLELDFSIRGERVGDVITLRRKQ